MNDAIRLVSSTRKFHTHIHYFMSTLLKLLERIKFKLREIPCFVGETIYPVISAAEKRVDGFTNHHSAIMSPLRSTAVYGDELQDMSSTACSCLSSRSASSIRSAKLRHLSVLRNTFGSRVFFCRQTISHHSLPDDLQDSAVDSEHF